MPICSFSSDIDKTIIDIEFFAPGNVEVDDNVFYN